MYFILFYVNAFVLLLLDTRMWIQMRRDLAKREYLCVLDWGNLHNARVCKVEN